MVEFGYPGGATINISGGSIIGPAIQGSGTNIATSGTVQFANSNGVTFGLTNNVITASVNGGTGGGGGFAAQGSGTYTQNSGTIQFANSNGVTFGLTNNQMTATVRTDYLTTAMASDAGSNYMSTGERGNYFYTSNNTFLTTAMASNAGSNFMSTSERGNYFYSSNKTFANSTHDHGTVAATNISATSASSGLSLSVGNYITTAMASNAGSNFMSTSERGNYFYSSNNTFANSTHTHGNLALTNINGTSASDGLSLSISPGGGGDGYNIIGVNGAGTSLSTTIQLSNSNNVTFGLNAGTITASASFNQTQQPMYYSASGTSTSSNTLQFANTNGVSFSLSNGSVVATVKTDYLTTAMQSQMTSNYMSTAERGNYFYTSNNTFANNTHTHGNVASTNISVTSASSGLSLSVGNYITTAMASNAGSNFIFASAGFNGTNVSGTLASNSVSFSVGNYITTARASNDAVGLNTAGTNVTWTVGSGGISLNAGGYAGTGTSATNATITLNSNGLAINVGAGGGAAISAGASSQNTGTVIFSNSNGVSFGLNNGTLTATVTPGAAAGIGAIAASNTTFTSGTVVMSAAGGALTIGSGAQTVNFSVPATSSLSAVSNITISSTGSTINFSVANPGGGVTLSEAIPHWNGLNVATNSALGQNSLYFWPVRIYDNLYAHRMIFFNSINWVVGASNSTASAGYTLSAAIYARQTDQTDRITSFWSGSIYMRANVSSNTNISVTHPNGIANSTSFGSSNYAQNNASASQYLNTSVAGLRPMLIPVSSTFTPGMYWFACARSHTSTNAFTWAVSNHIGTMASMDGFQHFANASSASAAGYIGAYQGLGTYSATSGAFPGSVTLTNGNIRNIPTAVIPLCAFSGWTTNASQI